MNGRFAPSPTGTLHVGNLRTALLAWLFARAAGSSFAVRMEDLDSGRVRERFYDEQLEDLRLLGLDWDGEVVRQSERSYDAALAALDTYECFCTRAEIREAVSAPHGPVGWYPGTCRSLSDAERAARRRERPGALRVRADGTVDDFVVRRADGAIAYNLAVVVDDDAQGVEQVVRGADLLDSTPRQIWLAQRLGLRVMDYVHVPLVLGPDGARLAKRHGSVTLREIPPAAALDWMAASLGLTGSTPREMLAGFDPAALPHEPTIFAPRP